MSGQDWDEIKVSQAQYPYKSYSLGYKLEVKPIQKLLGIKLKIIWKMANMNMMISRSTII